MCSSRWSDCTSFFLRAVNIFPSVIVADKFSGNILFFQDICKLFPSCWSRSLNALTHQVVEQIDGMRFRNYSVFQNKLALTTPRYVRIVLDVLQKLQSS